MGLGTATSEELVLGLWCEPGFSQLCQEGLRWRGLSGVVAFLWHLLSSLVASSAASATVSQGAA